MAKPAVSAVTNASENEIASVEQLIARARNALGSLVVVQT
jgi:hypothetical protein